MSLSETFLVSPLSVPGCQLWLDAADSTSVLFSSGNNVSQWSDKSGNDRHATQATASNQPTYANSNLSFNGTTSFLSLANFVARPLNIFTVVQANTVAAGQMHIFRKGRNPGSTFEFTIRQANADLVALWGYGVSTSLLNLTASASAGLTRNLLAATWDGSVANLYKDGTSIASSNLSASQFQGVSTYRIGASFATDSDLAAPSLLWNGTMQEILVYDRTPTTSGRQKIEGYLTWKWGLTANLPSTHPYKNSRPLNGIQLPPSLLVPSRPLRNVFVFNPTVISNCVLWLDGADVSTMFQNSSGTLPVRGTGSTVALWRDKSISGNHASNTTAQPTVTFNAQNGLPVINFSGSQYLTLSTTSLPTGATECTFFFLTRTTSSAVQVFLTYGAEPNTANRNPQFYYNSGVLSTDLYGGGGLSDNTNYLNSYVVTSCIFTLNRNTAWDNGSQFSGGSTAISLNTGTGWASIGVGRIPPGTPLAYYLTGQMGELVVFNRALNDQERQAMEGYLAWKWGTQSSLPVSHRSRTNPPDLPAAAPRGISQLKPGVFNPRNLPGNQLWLDAADSSTLFTNTTATTLAQQGQRIARWNDKSGNVNYLYQNTDGSRPTLLKTPVGTNAVYFATNALQLISISNNTTTGNASRTMFVVQHAPNASSIMRIGTGGHTVANPPTAFGFDNNVPVTTLWYPYVYNSPDITAAVKNQTFGVLYAYYDSGVSRVGGKYNFGNDQSKSTTLNTTANTWYFGLRPDGGGSVDSYVCEFLHFNRMLSTNEVAQVEGYLAWKWGLVANLPSTHPFKLFPPSP